MSAPRQSRSFVGTWNNPPKEFKTILDSWIESGDAVAIWCQLEKGDSGTPHVQMYVRTKANPANKNGYTVKWVTTNFTSKAHWEVRRGTHEEAVAYNTEEVYKGKSKGRIAGPWILGDATTANEDAVPGTAGRRKQKEDLNTIKKVIDGVDDQTLWYDHFSVMLNHSKAIEKFRLTIGASQRAWHTKFVVLYGPPGTGKSRLAKQLCDMHGGGFWLRKPKFGGTDWWDGYDPLKHQVIVIDEFYGWLAFEEVLRLGDRTPHQVETKGSMLPFLAKMVIFTSNKPPREWWSLEAVDDNRWKAFVRRISGGLGTVRHMTEVQVDESTILPDFEGVFERICNGDVDLDGNLLALDILTEQSKSSEPSYEETSDGYIDPDAPLETIDEIDEDNFDDADFNDYEEGWCCDSVPTHSYNCKFTLERGTQSRATSSTVPRKVLDLTDDTIDVAAPLSKKLKRTLSFHKVQDDRWGPEPVQSKLTFKAKTSKLNEAQKSMRKHNDDDDDIDDK